MVFHGGVLLRLSIHLYRIVEPDHSIERYPAFTDTDSAVDWRDQSNPDPGQLDLSTPTITPSPTTSSTPNPLPKSIINEIHADPDATLGDANGDGIVNTTQDEFLEIVNTTEDDINIDGWEIHDNIDVQHIGNSSRMCGSDIWRWNTHR